MEKSIQKAFDSMSQTFPSVDFGKALKDKYTLGLSILVDCFDKVMNREMVIRGFTCCGQDAVPDESGVTIDTLRR